MWAVLRWIAVNIAGLGVGYAASDLSRTIGEGADETKDSTATKIVREFGIPGYLAPLVAIAVLALIVYKAGWINKKA